MTDHVARLYALAFAVLVFFVAWAAVAAKPWAASAPTTDPRLAALTAREQRVRARAVAVRRVLDRRWAAYRATLVERERAIAAVKAANARAAALASAAAAAREQLAVTPVSSTPRQAASPATSVSAAAPAPAPAPTVRVVTLPPVTVTRTS